MDFDYVRNNLVQSIKEIANFVDVVVALDKIPEEQVTKKQSSGINEEWAGKFISDFNRYDGSQWLQGQD